MQRVSFSLHGCGWSITSLKCESLLKLLFCLFHPRYLPNFLNITWFILYLIYLFSRTISISCATIAREKWKHLSGSTVLLGLCLQKWRALLPIQTLGDHQRCIHIIRIGKAEFMIPCSKYASDSCDIFEGAFQGSHQEFSYVWLTPLMGG